MTSTTERDDLLAELRQARFFLRYTAKDLTDEQAAQRTTVSALSIGGLVKHVTDGERSWAGFVLEGPSAVSGKKDFSDWTAEDFAEREKGFAMQPGETLAGLLGAYEEVARATDELLRGIPSLDARQPLPKAPWYTAESQSARRTFLHIIAETTQHAGHADIIRESIDGQKTMG
ncbi:hypothetical protein GCM10011575_28620 [Microlunatus endophyticus]|uniref:DinB family protein n=1 Tax=Microlunatus endophyticus TaxID=1716077 RepID=A0A917W4S1_9ACTN|nr:DinB family protein [Microlunatus endophyticus]GGL68306.1 hypothetical protein GCM10011575_28620 [Microlunatus endophyticus]